MSDFGVNLSPRNTKDKTSVKAHYNEGGILTVYDDKIRLYLSFQFTQGMADSIQTGIAHHIAYR